MFNSFLYRRLARWITCVLKLPKEGEVYLSSKYDAASAADVFLNPFYWQIFGFLDGTPRLVVDCGAHCGHFSILVDVCSKMKFGRGADNFILIEPNPFFKPIIEKNLRNACVSGNWEIFSAALGASDGAKTTEMAIDPQNLLSASILKNDGFTGQKIKVKALSLSEVLFKFCRCSVMKMDIEGSEFFLMQSEPDVFRKADLVFIEVHWNKAVPTIDPVRFFQNLDFSLVFVTGSQMETSFLHGSQKDKVLQFIKE